MFALSAGAVSFGQIVKAAEPAFAALLGVTLYQKKVRKCHSQSLPSSYSLYLSFKFGPQYSSLILLGGLCLSSFHPCFLIFTLTNLDLPALSGEVAVSDPSHWRSRPRLGEGA